MTTNTHNIWQEIISQAHAANKAEPELGLLLNECVFEVKILAQAIIMRLSQRLQYEILTKQALQRIFTDVLATSPTLEEAFAADLSAVVERDPACMRILEPLLFFKGFHAIQAHRFAHALWQQGRQDMALYLQSRASEVFQTDIHPGAKFGQGIFLDHATGLVVGGTAVVEDNVSMLQNVTLGGTGKEKGDRHPKIRHGVLIGAGSKILGNIEVGACARIAAGSVVLKDVPPHMTVAGVPAKVIGDSGCTEPARDMNQLLSFDPVI